MVSDNHYAKYGKKWYEKNKESEAVRGKAYYQKTGKEKKLLSYPERRRTILKSRYGITPEQFDCMLVSQDNKCAICKQEYHLTMHIDHNHSTGEIRGLLCNNCNRGLGHFKDNPMYLVKALEYLSKFGNPDYGGSVDYNAVKVTHIIKEL